MDILLLLPGLRGPNGSYFYYPDIYQPFPNFAWAEYSTWMNRDIYSGPLSKLAWRELVARPGSSNDGPGIILSITFQMETTVFDPNIGFVFACKPCGGGGGGGGRDYNGGNAPPPPGKREKDCMCDCNDIATMIQRQLMEQAALVEGVKDHIDRRVKEEITAHGKQLEAMSLDLQPMMDRLNQIESNLWNGIKQ